ADAPPPDDARPDSPTGPAALTASPAAQAFGPWIVNTTSQTVTIAIENTGGASTGTLTATIGVGSFTLVQSTCTAPLAPAGVCTAQVRFSPISTGPKTGTLTISDGTVSAMVTLSGTGITTPVLQVMPSVADFGPTTVGTTSAMTVTVTNQA